MSRLSKLRLIMVQIFLAPVFALAQTPGSKSPVDLCQIMMNTSIEVLPAAARARALRHFPKKSLLRVIVLGTFKDLKIFAPVARSDGWFLRTPTGPQIVRAADALANEVLARSSVTKISREEVLTFAEVHNERITTFGDFTKGTSTSISGAQVDKAVARFLARLGRPPAGYVRLVHSHPEFDVRAVGADLSLTHHLSEKDVNIGRELSMRLDVPLVIEAVTPNGYTYAAVFYKGTNTTAFATDRNPLAELKGDGSNVTVRYVDEMPGPRPIAPPPPPPLESLPAWLRAAYDEYQRTSSLPDDPSLRAYLLRIDAARGGGR